LPALVLLPVGSIPAGHPEMLRRFLESRLNAAFVVSELSIDPSPAYDHVRGQYDSRRILYLIDDLAGKLSTRVLGVADVDLYSAVFTFVFGEAKLGGRAGLISLHRLRTTVYGLPEDPGLMAARARRESLHEVGHLFGLVHCREPDCVMRFSGVVEEVDLKSDDFCTTCRERYEAARR
jgi:archaemetzincin